MPEPLIFPPLPADTALAAAREVGLADVLSAVNLFRTTLHHPPMARIMADVVDALVLNSVLDARSRELAILRVGWRLGSVYEWSNHYLVAKRASMTDDEIVAVRSLQAPPLTEADLALLAVVDEALDDAVVSPGRLETARELLGDDRALMELVMIPGCYRAIASLLLSFRVPLEDHVAPWAPDGVSPSGPSRVQ